MPAEAAGPVNGPVTPIVAFLQDGPAAVTAVEPVFAPATDAAAAAMPSTIAAPSTARSFFMPSSLPRLLPLLPEDDGRRRLVSGARLLVASLLRAARGEEHAQDAHRPGSGVFDAVHLLRGEVEAGAGADRRRVAAHVGEAGSLDDVADLVVGVAVVRSPARPDDSEELGHVEAADVLVYEVAKAPVRVRYELLALVETHRDAAAPRRRTLLRGDDRHDRHRLVGRVVDGVRLARDQVRRRAGGKLVPPPVQLERPLARDDVQHLLPPLQPSPQRAPGPEANDPLLEPGASVRRVEHDARLGGVALLPDRRDRGFVDHVRHSIPLRTPHGKGDCPPGGEGLSMIRCLGRAPQCTPGGGRGARDA